MQDVSNKESTKLINKEGKIQEIAVGIEVIV